MSFDEAKEIWETSKSDPGYSEYMREFVQYNNYHKLDTKDGCYKLGGGPTEIYFAISLDTSTRYYRISSAYYVDEGLRVACFENSYLGVPVKHPPYMPFVFKMEFR